MSVTKVGSLLSEISHVTLFAIRLKEEEAEEQNIGAASSPSEYQGPRVPLFPSSSSSSLRWTSIPPPPDVLHSVVTTVVPQGEVCGRSNTGAGNHHQNHHGVQQSAREQIRQSDPILQLFQDDHTDDETDEEEHLMPTRNDSGHDCTDDPAVLSRSLAAQRASLLNILTLSSVASSCSSSTATKAPPLFSSLPYSQGVSHTARDSATPGNRPHTISAEKEVKGGKNGNSMLVQRIRELSALLAILGREPEWYQHSYAYELFITSMEQRGLISELLSGLLQSWDMWRAGKDQMAATPDCVLQLVLLHAEALVFYMHHRITILRGDIPFYFSFGCTSLQTAFQGGDPNTANTTTSGGRAGIEPLYDLLCQAAQELPSNIVAQRVALLVVSCLCFVGEELCCRHRRATGSDDPERHQEGQEEEDIDAEPSSRVHVDTILRLLMNLQDKMVDHFNSASPRVAVATDPCLTSSPSPPMNTSADAASSPHAVRSRLISHFAALALLQCAPIDLLPPTNTNPSAPSRRDGGGGSESTVERLDQWMLWHKLFPVISQGTMYDVDLTAIVEQDGPDASLLRLVKLSLGRALGRVWAQVCSPGTWWASFSLPCLLSVSRAATIFSFAWADDGKTLHENSQKQHQGVLGVLSPSHPWWGLSRQLSMPIGMLQLVQYVHDKIAQLCVEAVTEAVKCSESIHAIPTLSGPMAPLSHSPAVVSSEKTTEMLSYLTLYAYLCAACADSLAGLDDEDQIFSQPMCQSTQPCPPHQMAASRNVKNATVLLESLFVLSFALPEEILRPHTPTMIGREEEPASSIPSAPLRALVLKGLASILPMAVTWTSVRSSHDGRTMYVSLLPQYMQHLHMMVLSPHFDHMSSIAAHTQTSAAFVQSSCTLLCALLSAVHLDEDSAKGEEEHDGDQMGRDGSARTVAMCQRLDALAETNLVVLLWHFFNAYVQVRKPDLFLVAQLFTCVDKYYTFFPLLNIPGDRTAFTAMIDKVVMAQEVFSDLSGQQVCTGVAMALLQTHLFSMLYRSPSKPSTSWIPPQGGDDSGNGWYDFENHCHHHGIRCDPFPIVVKKMLQALSHIRVRLLTYQSSALTVYLTVARQLYELSMEVEQYHNQRNVFLLVLQREAGSILAASPSLVNVLMEGVATLQRQCSIGRLYAGGGYTIQGALTFTLQILAILTCNGEAYDLVANTFVPVLHIHGHASTAMLTNSMSASRGSGPVPGVGSLPGLSVLLHVLFSPQSSLYDSPSTWIPFNYTSQRLCAEIWCWCVSKSTRAETFHTIRLSLRSGSSGLVSDLSSSPSFLSSLAVECLKSGIGHPVNVARLQALLATLRYDYRLFMLFITTTSNTAVARGADESSSATSLEPPLPPTATAPNDPSDLRLVKLLCEMMTTTTTSGGAATTPTSSPQERALALDLLRGMGLTDAVSTNAVSRAIRCSATPASSTYHRKMNRFPGLQAPVHHLERTGAEGVERQEEEEKNDDAARNDSLSTTSQWLSSETTSTYLDAYQAAAAARYINAMLQRRQAEEIERAAGTAGPSSGSKGHPLNNCSTPMGGSTPRSSSRAGSMSRGVSMVSAASGGGGKTMRSSGAAVPAPIALPTSTSSNLPGVTDLLQSVLESGSAHMRHLQERISQLFPHLVHADVSVEGCDCVAGVLPKNYLHDEATRRLQPTPWEWGCMETRTTALLRCPLVLGKDFCFQPGTTTDDTGHNVAASLLYALRHLCDALNKTVLLYTHEALDSNIARSQRLTELMVVTIQSIRAVLCTGTPLLSALQSQSISACLQLSKTLSTIMEQMRLSGISGEEQNSLLPYASAISSSASMTALTEAIRYLALVFLPAHQHLLPVVTDVLTILRPFGLEAVDHHAAVEQVIAVLGNQLVKSAQRMREEAEWCGSRFLTAKNDQGSLHTVAPEAEEQRRNLVDGKTQGSEIKRCRKGEHYPPKLLWRWEDAFFEEAHLFMIQHGVTGTSGSLQSMTVGLVHSIEQLASHVTVAGVSDIWVSRCTGRLHFLQTLLHQHPHVQGYISKASIMSLALALGQLWSMPALTSSSASVVLSPASSHLPCAAQEVWCAVLELLQSILTCGGYNGAFRATKTGWLDAVMPLCLTPRLRWALTCFNAKARGFVVPNALGSHCGSDGLVNQEWGPPFSNPALGGVGRARVGASLPSPIFIWDVQECHLAMQLVSSLAALGGFMESTIPCVILGFNEVQSSGFLLHVTQVSDPSVESEERERMRVYTCQIIRDALSFLVLQPSFLMPLHRFISSARSNALSHALQWDATECDVAGSTAGITSVRCPAEGYMSFLVLYRFIVRLLQSIQRSPGLLSGLSDAEWNGARGGSGITGTSMLGLLTGANGKPLFAAAGWDASPMVAGGPGGSTSGSRSPSMDALSMITEIEDFPLTTGGSAGAYRYSTGGGENPASSRTTVTAETLPLYMESVELALSVFMRAARDASAAESPVSSSSSSSSCPSVLDRELRHEVYTAANNLAYTLSTIEKGLQEGGGAEILIPFVKSRRRQIQKILSTFPRL